MPPFMDSPILSAMFSIDDKIDSMTNHFPYRMDTRLSADSDLEHMCLTDLQNSNELTTSKCYFPMVLTWSSTAWRKVFVLFPAIAHCTKEISSHQNNTLQERKALIINKDVYQCTTCQNFLYFAGGSIIPQLSGTGQTSLITGHSFRKAGLPGLQPSLTRFLVFLQLPIVEFCLTFHAWLFSTGSCYVIAKAAPKDLSTHISTQVVPIYYEMRSDCFTTDIVSTTTLHMFVKMLEKKLRTHNAECFEKWFHLHGIVKTQFDPGIVSELVDINLLEISSANHFLNGMHHSSGLVLLWVYPLGAKSENTPSDASSELFMEVNLFPETHSGCFALSRTLHSICCGIKLFAPHQFLAVDFHLTSPFKHVDPSILGKLFIPLLSLALENALSELLVLICKPFDPGILAEKSLVTHEPLHGFQAYHLFEVQLVLHLWFCLVKLEHLLQHVTLWQGHFIGDGFLWHSIVVDKSIGTSLAVGRDSWSYFSQSQLKILEMELDKTCLAWDPLVCFRTEFTSQTLYSFHGLWTHSTTLLEWILIIA